MSSVHFYNKPNISSTDMCGGKKTVFTINYNTILCIKYPKSFYSVDSSGVCVYVRVHKLFENTGSIKLFLYINNIVPISMSTNFATGV